MNLATQLMSTYVRSGQGFAATFWTDAESCRREAQQAYGQSATGEQDAHAYSILLLSAQIKYWILGLNPLRTDITIYGTLLTAALDEVDWDTVAGDVLDSLPTTYIH